MIIPMAEPGSGHIPHISLSKILAYHQLGMTAGIGYLLGAKPAMDKVPAQIKVSDCSGWSRYLVYHASQHQLLLPEGSVQQHEWADRNGLHPVSFADAVKYGSVSRLFLCFIVPETQPDKIGHVYMLHGCGEKARTMECYGGHGVGSRKYNASIDGGRTDLERACGACYEWPCAA
jgi:hypothetical protein